jgi:carboxymethylenebutenolidase
MFRTVLEVPARELAPKRPRTSERIVIKSADGGIPAYLARPARRNAPAIVVAHDILGVNADARWLCDQLADEGYFAVCPDLFWRSERGIGLSGRRERDLEAAAALYASFDTADGVSDLVATVRTARTVSGTSEKVGMLGHGMGGLLAFLVSARIGLDAAAAYFGRGTEFYLAEAAFLQSPLMIHLAQEDRVMGREARRVVAEALTEHPWVELHVHAGAAHGFTRRLDSTFNAVAAERANRLTLTLFDKFLRFNYLDDSSEQKSVGHTRAE